MPDGNKPIIPVRFPPTMAATARRLAESDGVDLSTWVRRLVDREIVARAGKCVTCGQPFAELLSEEGSDG